MKAVSASAKFLFKKNLSFKRKISDQLWLSLFVVGGATVARATDEFVCASAFSLSTLCFSELAVRVRVHIDLCWCALKIPLPPSLRAFSEPPNP